MDRAEVEVVQDLSYAWAVRCMRAGCPHVILVSKRHASEPQRVWCVDHPPDFIVKHDIAVNEPVFEGVDVETRPSVGFFNPPRSDI